MNEEERLRIKSVRDCLNFIDIIVLNNSEKYVGIGNLEDLRSFILETYNDIDFIIMSGFLSQINRIIEEFYNNDNSDLKKEYWILRQHILALLMVKKNGIEE